MLKPQTRVVRLDHRGVPESLLGTVEHNNGYHVTVKWDDGGYSAITEGRLIPHQKLKAWFKHGPKLYKKSPAERR